MEKRPIGESDPANNQTHQPERGTFLRYLDRLFRNAENDQVEYIKPRNKASLFIKRLLQNSVNVPPDAADNNINVELRQDDLLFDQPEKIVEAERSQLINPGDVLAEVAKAAAHDVAIESVYEKRAEIRKDNMVNEDVDKSEVDISDKSTDIRTSDQNLRSTDFNLTVPKPPGGSAMIIKKYVTSYNTAIRNGFLAGLAFLIVLLVLMVFIDG